MRYSKIIQWLLRWLSGKESTCQCRRHSFSTRVERMPWRRKWQPTWVFLPGKCHGQRSLVGYSLWGCRVGHTLVTQEQQPNIQFDSLKKKKKKKQPWILQFCSVAQSCLTVIPRTAARQASLSITNSQSLLKLMSIVSVMTSNHLILCHPLLLTPSILPSIRVFSNESVLCIRWPKYWNFSFSISLSNEYSGLISFRMDWLDLLAVQGTLKSLLQHHRTKAWILRRSAFFIV